MKLRLVTPAPPGSQRGNRVTAVRWGRLLRSLGHRVRVEEEYRGGPCDVLIALHARRSYPSIVRYRQDKATAPLILALTGTDLYGDILTNLDAQQALRLADRLVVLQALGVEALPADCRSKTRVILQSVVPPTRLRTPRIDRFTVCLLGHLREVKDPFRAAEASRLVPPESRLALVHLGEALSEEMAQRARLESASNSRYAWLGEIPRRRALRILSGCRLLVLTSLLEGGANVISEAISVGVPVLSSRIDGSMGLLGRDYPGLFDVGDTEGLARLLWRCESEPTFLGQLHTWCARLRPLIDPSHERESWRQLLAEFTP